MRRFLSILVLCALPSLAVGQEGEIRIAATPRLGIAATKAFDGSANALAGGGEVRVSYGFADRLDIGGAFSYLTSRDIELAGASSGSVGGDGFSLFAHLHDFEVTGTVRLLADSWLSPRFLRFHPYAGIRLGLAARHLADPQLFSASGTAAGTQSATTDIFLVGGLETGASYRLTSSLELTGGLSASTSGTRRTMVGLDVGVAWFFF